MKFIIEHSNTKRNIIGNFNICGSSGDLRILAEQILMQIGDPDVPRFIYGWIHITESQPSIVNTKPKEWDE